MPWVWLLLACSTELDPTLLVAAPDTGGSGALLDAGSTCTSLTVGSRTFLTCSRPLAAYVEAEDYCRRQGAELARVASAEENEALAVHGGQSDSTSTLWLGGRRDEEHVWRWPDGTVFWTGLMSGTAPPDAFVNWQSAEPNNDSTLRNEPEACLSLRLSNGSWSDRSCSLQLSYVCQLPSAEP